jgi:ferredoxin
MEGAIMTAEAYIHKLAELSGFPDSEAFHRMLKSAMTDDEARFIFEMPATNIELAEKFNMTEKDVEEKILNLAQRGVIAPSIDPAAEGRYCFQTMPALFHDNILSSSPQYIPDGFGEAWRDLYEGEKMWRDIGEDYKNFKAPILRIIPAEKSIPQEIELLPHESITKIIEENRDLITIRNCPCRTGAQKCHHHPINVCMQFKSRAEYDLYRGSGRKVSAEEAVSVALTAVGSGLFPNVTNISTMDALEFICFCCGCACLLLHPALQTGTLDKALAPSRFEAKVNYETCNGCRHCVPRCEVGALEMRPIPGYDTIKAVLDPDKCVGCGVCELACLPGSITMELVRPPEFIPDAIADEKTETLIHV